MRAEVGAALHGTGGKYAVRMTVTDTTNPALVDTQNITGNYGDANWPAPGLNTFSFTRPGVATAVGSATSCSRRLASSATLLRPSTLRTLSA